MSIAKAMEARCFTAGLFIFLITVVKAPTAGCPKEVVTVSGDSGTIKTPGYPKKKYPNNIECRWKIEVPQGYRVELLFKSEFSLQGGTTCPFDYVEVRNGPNITDKLLGKFCGDVKPRPIFSSGRNMFIIFKSDFTYRGKGYQASYKAIQPACLENNKLTSATGSFTSPSYPMSYHNDETCTWIIVVPQGHVRLTFKAFSVAKPCDQDYLIVRDGSTAKSALKGRFCGSSLPPVLRSSTRRLFVQFVTDSSRNEKGFSATYTSVKDKYEHKVENGTEGTISSPGYPDYDYPNTEEYRWSITVPDERILLSFDYFNLEDAQFCSKDYLEIRDGANYDSPLIKRICGPTLPDNIYSSGSSLSLKFVSDHNVTSKGFQLSYKGEQKQKTTSPTDEGLDDGEIAGIVIGALFGFFLLCCVLVNCCRAFI